MDWQRTTVYTAEDGPYRLEVVRYPAGPRMWRIRSRTLRALR